MGDREVPSGGGLFGATRHLLIKTITSIDGNSCQYDWGNLYLSGPKCLE